MNIISGGGKIIASAECLDGKELVETLELKLRYYTPRQIEEHLEKLTTPEDPKGIQASQY